MKAPPLMDIHGYKRDETEPNMLYFGCDFLLIKMVLFV